MNGLLLSLLFLLASIGVVNGLVAGVILLFQKKKLAKRFLGALLIALSIRIGKSVFYYFDSDTDRLILQLGLSACVFIGPLYYLYISYMVKRRKALLARDMIGLGLLFLAILSVGLVFPYRSHPEVWNSVIVSSIYIIWSFFTVVGAYQASTHIKDIFNTYGLKGAMRDEVSIVTVALLFITSTYMCAFFISGFVYIWGAIAFTLFFYYSIIRVLIGMKYRGGKAMRNGSKMLMKVNVAMRQNQLFLNPKLRLDDLAEKVAMDRNSLSQLLNVEYPHGFSTYVNDFRVQEAKKLIKLRPELSLEGVGYEAGFNSKSSFFAAFKKLTGHTPAHFRKQKA